MCSGDCFFYILQPKQQVASNCMQKLVRDLSLLLLSLALHISQKHKAIKLMIMHNFILQNMLILKT